MTDRELAAAAWAELTRTTITYGKWKQQGFTPGHWANAKGLLDQIGATPPPPPPAAGWPANPYPVGSVWNPGHTITNPQVDPNSAAMISYFVSTVTTPKLVVGPWSVPVVQVHGGEPTFTVKQVQDGHAPATINNLGPVPIPAGTKPDPGGDGHLSILDYSRGIEWGFWRARFDGTDWWCTGGNALHFTDQAGPAWFNGANTANFPAAAGLVTPEEIRDGHITHPLVFAVNHLKSGKRCPATYGYGSSTDANALVAGTWVQLDPAYDVTQLSAWQRTVARALQEYGAYVRDQTGGTDGDFYAENTINRPSAPSWSSLGINGNTPFSTAFPWSRLRVLVPPC